MKNYLPGLDGLRFIAATAVLVHHVELLKGDFGYGELWRTRFFADMGPLSVTFFFVLSGYLITYLLLKEKNETRSISLSFFYYRRILRIFPLYYLIVFLSFLVLPQYRFFDQPYFSEMLSDSFFEKFIWYLALLPQVVFILFGNAPVPYGVQAWSIGVEEQFYLVWPFAIKKMKNVLLLFVSVFLVFALAPVLLAALKSLAHLRHSVLESPVWFAQRYAQTVRFSCMALGAGLAYLVVHKVEKVLSVLYHSYLQMFAYVLLIALMVRGYPFRFFMHELFSILFGVLIVNVSSNSSPGIHQTFSKLLNWPLLDFLGKRSYGIYMYHMIGIQIAINGYRFLFPGLQPGVLQNLVLYGAVMGVTFLLSLLSYQFFEKKILALRKYQVAAPVQTHTMNSAVTNAPDAGCPELLLEQAVPRTTLRKGPAPECRL
jgi:peptidoglycan/LPS O-acetylase OafA/YrhL